VPHGIPLITVLRPHNFSP